MPPTNRTSIGSPSPVVACSSARPASATEDLPARAPSAPAAVPGWAPRSVVGPCTSRPLPYLTDLPDQIMLPPTGSRPEDGEGITDMGDGLPATGCRPGR